MITLTDTAAVKVQELIKSEGEDTLALRVAVRPGGCSGFSYQLFFDSEIDAEDVTHSYGTSKLWSIRRAPRCSKEPPSTTTTGSPLALPSRIPTRSAPAGAGPRLADPFPDSRRPRLSCRLLRPEAVGSPGSNSVRLGPWFASISTVSQPNSRKRTVRSSTRCAVWGCSR